MTRLKNKTPAANGGQRGLFNRRSLSVELTISLVTVVVVVVGAILFLLYNRQSDLWYRQLQTKADEYAINLSETLAVPMWDFDDEQIRRIGEGYTRNNIVTTLIIQESDGTVLYQYHLDTETTQIIREQQIKHGGKSIGQIRLALSLDTYRSDQLWLRNIAIVVLAVCFVVITTATGILLRVLMRTPMALLYQGMDRVALGDYDYRFEEVHHEEMINIARRFSTMADKIRKREQSLQKEVRDRKHAEKKSRENEARTKAILDAIPDVIFQFDREGRFLDVRGEAEELLIPAEKIIGCRLDRVMPSKISRVFHRQLNAAFEIRSVRVFEYQLSFNNGIRHFECRLVAVSDQLAIGIVRDITRQVTAAEEKRRLIEQLQRAQKMEALGMLAGGVAHDLNNILSGLVSYPELILMDLPPKSPLRKPIRTIQRSGERAANIVQDLLTLARRGVSVAEMVNLNQIIQDYLKSPEYRALCEHHPEIDWQLDLADDLLNISGSPIHLTKTVMNLVSNAAEASVDQGSIRITTENRYIDTPIKGYEDIQEGDYVVLTVADKGIGISEEDINRIFEPFYTKKVMGRSGTGLGMAVVWGTVKDHHGAIDVSSTPRQGTTVTILLPATTACRIQSSDPETIDDLMGHGQRILVIDDIEEQRQIATDMLMRLGYEVESVASGEAAIDYVRRQSVDLLLLDMIMEPGIDGLETYRRIIDFSPGQQAVITSGFSESERVQETRRLGAGAYVKKPYRFETLAKAVRSVLEDN